MCGDRQWTEDEIREAMAALGDSGWHCRIVRDDGTPDRLHGPKPFSTTYDEAAGTQDEGSTPTRYFHTKEEHTYFIPHGSHVLKYVIPARFWDELVSRGHPVDNFVRADPVSKVRPSVASPTVRPGGRSSGSVEGHQHDDPCPWDTDGDGNCAFHSDCASRTFRSISTRRRP